MNFASLLTRSFVLSPTFRPVSKYCTRKMAGSSKLSLDLAGYLKNAAASIKCDNIQIPTHEWNVHVVVGNEACDLDSAVSAVVHAYHLSQSSANGSSVPVPVLNIPREDYSLKTEVKFAFNEHQISAENLIFLDDHDWKRLHEQRCLKVTLVDHHIPSGGFLGMESDVVEVIDHRTVNYNDGRADYLRDVPHTIELVGSCSTLIAERLLNTRSPALNPVTAQLLYSAILLDTSNFSKETKKATPKDEQVAAKLEKVLEKSVSKEQLYKSLKKAKSDVSGMSVTQLLKKDPKLLDVGHCQLLVSSVPVGITDFVRSNDELDELRRICSDRKLDGVVILGSVLKSQIEKSILLYMKEPLVCDAIAESLCSNTTCDLDLLPSSLDFTPQDPTRCKYFKQRNVVPSRKQILPLLRDIVSVQKILFGREVPETATPPNTYVEKGCMGNQVAFSEKLRKQVEAAVQKESPEHLYDYDARKSFEPFTPSNTYIDKDGHLMKNSHKDQVADLLRNRIAQLDVDTLSPDAVSSCERSRHHSGTDEENVHEHKESEIFEMDKD